MEYTFKYDPSREPVTVELSEYSLSMKSDRRETLIPYANILTVRLKKSGRRFITIIKPADQPEIHITNLYVYSNNQIEDRSREYVAFVRILHTHLCEKSVAYYVCGNNLQGILLLSCLSVIAAFGLSYMVENVQLNPFNSNLTALILSVLSLSLIAIVNWGHFPNAYKPKNIPLQFLPAINA